MRNYFGSLNIYLRGLEYSCGALVILALFGLLGFLAWPALSGSEPISVILIPTVLGVVPGLFLYILLRRGAWTVWKDLFSAPTAFVGRVSQKSRETKGFGGYARTEHRIVVEGRKFDVSGAVYDWLSEGDEITVSCWPNSTTLSRVDRASIH